jgi:putative transposase
MLTDWSNFKAALRAWKRDPSKFTSMPKPPYYKNKLAQVIFYNETIKKEAVKTRDHHTNKQLVSVKCNKDFKQVVVTPKTFGFVVDVQYEQESKKEKVSKDNVACIDIGVNNLATITSNQL